MIDVKQQVKNSKIAVEDYKKNRVNKNKTTIKLIAKSFILFEPKNSVILFF